MSIHNLRTNLHNLKQQSYWYCIHGKINIERICCCSWSEYLNHIHILYHRCCIINRMQYNGGGVEQCPMLIWFAMGFNLVYGLIRCVHTIHCIGYNITYMYLLQAKPITMTSLFQIVSLLIRSYEVVSSSSMIYQNQQVARYWDDS